MRHCTPGILFNSFTTNTWRSRNAFSIGVMQPWSPFNAASAATCEIEVGFEVLCDCTFSIAVMMFSGPAA